MLFLAFCEADFQLDPATGVMQVQRDHGVAGAFDLADQLADFLGVHQKLAGAHGIRLHMG